MARQKHKDAKTRHHDTKTHDTSIYTYTKIYSAHFCPRLSVVAQAQYPSHAERHSSADDDDSSADSGDDKVINSVNQSRRMMEICRRMSKTGLMWRKCSLVSMAIRMISRNPSSARRTLASSMPMPLFRLNLWNFWMGIQVVGRSHST